MCGISGLYRFDQKPVTRDVIHHMNEQMIWRGPDDEGIFTDRHFGMGMRRLSIIDLATGQQPISNETNDVHVVLNGEIYNYIELREELKAKGHQFKTGSDVEVLVHLYEEHGTQAVQYLNGMFAFSLWDQKRALLWLGRDRLGIKPLVYVQRENYLAFGSTNDVINALESETPQLDYESFLLYLQLSYVPAPRSLYKDIKKLMPGHTLTVQQGQVQIQKYWQVPVGEYTRRSNAEFVSEMTMQLKSSIELHSRSDVPVCSFLSGGIDSSAVTALFSEQSEQAVHTYSVDFQNKRESDLAYAKLVAERYHTEHHPYEITSDMGFDCLAELLPRMDEPMADSAIIPSYYLTKEARARGVKVALSGAGGDELFGGYHRHFHHAKDYFIGQFSLVPKRFWLQLACLDPRFVQLGIRLNDSGIDQALATSGVNLGVLQHLLKHKGDLHHGLDLLEAQFCEQKEFEAKTSFSYARMITDVKNYLADNILALFDKTSMAASVEGRVPLLDHRLVELAFTTEPSQNILADDYKHSFKKCIGSYVPQKILTRSKTGFNAPVRDWVAKGQRDVIMNRLQNPRCPLIPLYLNMDRLREYKYQHWLTHTGHETLFALYVLDVWYESHF